MIAETRYALGNLTRFDGRDSRRTFWFYVAALVIANVVMGVIATVPFMASVAGTAASQVQNGGTPQDMVQAMMVDMASGMKTQLVVSAVLAAITFALFAAAFVRRLHDSGKTGWIALIPLMTTAYVQVFAFTHVDDIIMAMQAAMAANDPQQIADLESTLRGYSAVGWIGYLVVIVFGALQGNPGPNRYGEAPAAL